MDLTDAALREWLAENSELDGETIYDASIKLPSLVRIIRDVARAEQRERDVTRVGEVSEQAASVDHEKCIAVKTPYDARPWEQITEDHRRSHRETVSRIAPTIVAAIRAQEVNRE